MIGSHFSDDRYYFINVKKKKRKNTQRCWIPYPYFGIIMKGASIWVQSCLRWSASLCVASIWVQSCLRWSASLCVISKIFLDELWNLPIIVGTMDDRDLTDIPICLGNAWLFMHPRHHKLTFPLIEESNIGCCAWLFYWMVFKKKGEVKKVLAILKNKYGEDMVIILWSVKIHFS